MTNKFGEAAFMGIDMLLRLSDLISKSSTTSSAGGAKKVQ
jgi:hypothetical protein